jgi:soluble lytic murein transglycosylase
MIKNQSKKTLIISALAVAALIFVSGCGLAAFFLAYKPDKIYVDAAGYYGQKYDVERALIFSVIKTESNYKQNARSDAGALGLMQLMPETAVWIAGKINKTDYDEAMLTGVDCNIELGTWYLSYLIKKFESVDIALIAYNAGEGNAQKWIRENKINDIPFKETKNYLKKVKRHYKYYKRFNAF